MYHRDNRAFYGNGRAVHVIPTAKFYFPFEEGTGTVCADWMDGSIKAVSLVGAVTWVPGHKSGTYATSYGGLDKYGDGGTVDAFTNNWTISFWTSVSVFQTASAGAFRSLVSKHDLATPNRTFTMCTVNPTTISASANKFGIALGLATGASGYIGYYDSSIPINEWYHLAATFKDGNLHYYINGAEVALTSMSGQMPTTIFNSTVPLTIGVHWSLPNPVGSNYCRVDDLVAFDRVLTSTEIADLYAWQA